MDIKNLVRVADSHIADNQGDNLHDEIVNYIKEHINGPVSRINPWFDFDVWGDTKTIDTIEWDKYNNTYLLHYTDGSDPDMLSDFDDYMLKSFLNKVKLRLK